MQFPLDSPSLAAAYLFFILGCQNLLSESLSDHSGNLCLGMCCRFWWVTPLYQHNLDFIWIIQLTSYVLNVSHEFFNVILCQIKGQTLPFCIQGILCPSFHWPSSQKCRFLVWLGPHWYPNYLGLDAQSQSMFWGAQIMFLWTSPLYHHQLSQNGQTSPHLWGNVLWVFSPFFPWNWDTG